MSEQPLELLHFGLVNCIREVGPDGVARPREPMSVYNPGAWQAYLEWLEREPAPEQEPLPEFESD